MGYNEENQLFIEERRAIKINPALLAIIGTVMLYIAIASAPAIGAEQNDIIGIGATDALPVSSGGGMSASITPGACGPIDLVIALDDTGSMGGAISNIRAELPAIISTALMASGNDLKVGYMTFKDNVVVHNELTTNITAIEASINATFANGGAGAPEASDEAKNTFVNNLAEGTRNDSAGNLGAQIGNFTTPYRAGATKIAVLITDAPPGGFNDVQDLADNVSLSSTHALTALANGIKVSDVFVPTGGDYAGQAGLLAQDANITGGVFVTTAANGNGTGSAITKIIEECGGVPEVKGRMTGGGSVFAEGNGRVTHGFELHCDVSKAPNNLQVNWGKNNKFHLESLNAALCSDDPAIEPKPPTAGFDIYEGKGTGRYNGISGATIKWKFTDAGEPGKSDSATMSIWDAGGNLVISVSGNLNSGNQQAHEE